MLKRLCNETKRNPTLINQFKAANLISPGHQQTLDSVTLLTEIQEIWWLKFGKHLNLSEQDFCIALCEQGFRSEYDAIDGETLFRFSSSSFLCRFKDHQINIDGRERITAYIQDCIVFDPHDAISINDLMDSFLRYELRMNGSRFFLLGKLLKALLPNIRVRGKSYKRLPNKWTSTWRNSTIHGITLKSRLLHERLNHVLIPDLSEIVMSFIF